MAPSCTHRFARKNVRKNVVLSHYGCPLYLCVHNVTFVITCNVKHSVTKIHRSVYGKCFRKNGLKTHFPAFRFHLSPGVRPAPMALPAMQSGNTGSRLQFEKTGLARRDFELWICGNQEPFTALLAHRQPHCSGPCPCSEEKNIFFEMHCLCYFSGRFYLTFLYIFTLYRIPVMPMHELNLIQHLDAHYTGGLPLKDTGSRRKDCPDTIEACPGAGSN
jgi:hypothetical protein